MNPQTDNQPSTETGMPKGRFRRIGRLCQKELREILRDRRTIVTLVLMPLVLYPVLSMAFQRFLLSQAILESSNATIFIGVENDQAGKTIFDFLSVGHQLLAEQDKRPLATPQIGVRIFENLLTPLRENSVDVSIRVTRQDLSRSSEELHPTEFEIFYRANSSQSEKALNYFEEYFQAVNDDAIAAKLQSRGLTFQPIADVTRHPTEAEPPSSFSFASLIPLILILMTITGAVYPAIDLTAGERERGTLEALIAAPVPRSDLLLAKYSAVVTVALLTALANLIGMGATLYTTGLGATLFGKSQPLVSTLILVFGLLILFSLFFSAVLLAVTSFARSFKEAQAYLIPLLLVSLSPGIVSLSPGIELRGLLQFTPLVNIVLLARDILDGTAQLTPALAAIISTLIYAAISIVMAGRIFGSDTALYGSQGTWSDWLQRPPIASSVARLSTAMMCLIIILPIYILLAQLIGSASDANIGTRLALASSVTILLFGVIPVAFALIARIRIATAFQIQPANTMAFLAAGLLGFSLWPFAYEISVYYRSLDQTAFTQERIQLVQELLAANRTLPWGFLFITIAMIPAIFEELFFRGFLLSSFQRYTSPTKAIVYSAILFGLFHVVAGSLLLERLLPSTMMGIVLAWLCTRAKSIFPGILLHACHNGLLVTMAYFEDWITAKGIGTQQQIHLPPYWLTCATIGTVTGVLVIRYFVTPFQVDPSVDTT